MDEGDISRCRGDSNVKVVTCPQPPVPSPSRRMSCPALHHPRPPNRVKHEQQIEQLVGNISKAEAERGSLVNRVRIKRDKISEVKDEKDKLNADKPRVFDYLEWANKEVRVKGDLVQKLRSGLSHGRVDDIEEQIKKLEWQLARNTFKVPEERRLVTEIDRLKRSKRILIDYNREKEELKRLREEQKVAREGREEWFKCAREIKAKEDQLRADLRQLIEKMEECKKQAEQLRHEKRALIDEYRNQEFMFRKWQSEKRAEQKRKTELERAQAAHAAAAELAELKATCEPLLTERQLCSALIQYCEKLTGTSSAVSTPVDVQADVSGMFLTLPVPPSRRRSSGFSTNSGCSSNYGTPLGVTPATTPLTGSPPVSIDNDTPGFYKKKDDTEIFFAGSKKKNKKARSERRLSLKKGLTHNPETFLQFSTLGLVPPPTMSSVSEVTKKLREKLNQLEVQAAEIKLARLNVAQDCTDEVDGKAKNVPEIKVGTDTSVPSILIFEPASPGPDSSLSEELPQVCVDPSPPPQYDRRGLSLDLKCRVIAEVAVDNTHVGVNRNTSENHVREISLVRRENNKNGDSKYPSDDVTSCDKIASNDKFSKPQRQDTHHIIVPSPEMVNTEGPYAPNCTNLIQTKQNFVLANN